MAPRTLLPLLLLPLPVVAQVTTLLDETFASGQRSVLNLPAGAQWFSGSGSTSVIYTDNTSILLITGASGRHLLGYFTEDGSPVTLANPGERLTIKVDFTLDGVPGSSALTSTSMRLGFFDSTPGTRVTADNQNTTSTFDNYLGYILTMSPGSTTVGSMAFRERTSTTGAALISTTAAYTTVGTNGDSQALTFGQVYTGTLTLTRTEAGGLEFASLFTGPGVTDYAFSRVDDTPSTTSFDTFVFHNTSLVGDSFTIRGLEITRETIVIPEPGALALLGVGSLAGLLAFRRRR